MKKKTIFRIDGKIFKFDVLILQFPFQSRGFTQQKLNKISSTATLFYNIIISHGYFYFTGQLKDVSFFLKSFVRALGIRFSAGPDSASLAVLESGQEHGQRGSVWNYQDQKHHPHKSVKNCRRIEHCWRCIQLKLTEAESYGF